MLKTRKLKIKPKHLPRKSKDVPVTQAMLFEVRDHLKHEMNSNLAKINARFNQMESRFSEIDARFNQMESRFSEIDARFNQMESKLEKVLSGIHRVGLLVEEQNARNKFVLDGYTSLSDRLDKVELEVLK